ncbi:hypothetical protein PENTCL1PPCAC_12085, partial [Pristionchus entomophagus]
VSLVSPPSHPVPICPFALSEMSEIKKLADNPMPLLFINLGAEMLYVLDQRLRSVGTDKAARVLTDLINNMFKAEKLQKYFLAVSCDLSFEDMKKHFQDIATSSIMKLNTTSMDKLFDLMVMTLKYQLQMLIAPEHLVTLTVNHLDGILSMFQDHEEISGAVQYAYRVVMDSYSKALACELYLLRCEMLTYFQNCRVKTSLLMRAGKQNDEGYFITSKDDLIITERTETPGFVRYYEDTVLTKTEEFRTHRPDKRIELGKEDLRLQQTPRLTDLGSNMYRKEQEKMVRDDEPNAGEATLLSAIISRGNEEKDNFDLSLFDSNADESEYAQQAAATAAAMAAHQNAVHIDASKQKKSLSSAISEMKTGGGAKKKKGADLLDMFDEAAARPPTGSKKRGGSLKASKPKAPASADGERPTTRKAAGRPSSQEGAARPASKSATRPTSKAGTAAGAAAPRSRPASKEGARPASKTGGSRPASGAPVERARSASAKKRTPPN